MIFLITLLSVTSSLLVAQEVGSNEKSKPAVPSTLDLDKEPLASIIKYYSTSQKPTAFKTNINPRIRSVSSPLVHKSLSSSLLKSSATTPPSSQIIGFGPLTSQVSPTFYNSKPLQTKGLSTYGKLSNSVQPSSIKPIDSSFKNKSSKNFDISNTTPYTLPRSSTAYSFILPIIKYKSKEPSKSKSSYKSDKSKSSSAPKGVLGLPSFTSTPYTGDFGKSSTNFGSSLYSPSIKQPSRDSGETNSFKPSYVIVSPIYNGLKDKKTNLTSSESKSNSSKYEGFPIISPASYGSKKPQSAESAVDSKVFFNLPFIAFNMDSTESKEGGKGTYAPYFTTAPLMSKEASPENQEYIKWAFPRYQIPSQLNAPDVSQENENNSKEKGSSEVTGSQFEYSAKHGLPFYGKVLQPKPFEVSILGMPDFGKYVESAIRNAKENIANDKDAENVEKNVSAVDENQSDDNDNKEEIKTPNEISKITVPLIKKTPARSKLKEDHKAGDKYYHHHHDNDDSREIHHNKKYKWVNGKIVPKCRKLPHSPYPNVVVKNLPHNIAKNRPHPGGSHHHHHYNHHHNHLNKQGNSADNGKGVDSNSKVLDSEHPLKKAQESRSEDSTEIIEKIRQDLQGGKKPILEDAEVLFPSDLRPRNKTGQKDKSNEKGDKSNESRNVASSQKDKSAEDRKKGYRVREESREKDNKSDAKEKESSETRKASSEKDRTKEERENTKEESSKESKANKEEELSSKDAEAKAEEEKRKEEEARREEELRREEEARLEAEAEEREKEIEREILEEFKAVFPDISSLSDFDDDQDYYGRSSRRDRSSSREKDGSREDHESAREEDDEDEDSSKVKVDYVEQEIIDDLKHPHTTYMDGDERKKSKKTKFGTPRYGSRSKSSKLSQRDSDELDDDEFFKGWHTE